MDAKKKLNFAFQWHITEVCPNHCKHCYMYHQNERDLLDTHLSWDDFLDSVDNSHVKIAAQIAMQRI